jgi:cellulose synthase/poly-beta-1,6-N-acetylglucosamine synthase-like glycosyltransferase
VTLEILAYAALALALLPAVLTALNLAVFRAPPRSGPGPRPRVSLLIPARDEEANIGAALGAALASEGVELEVLVLDDGSTDRTAAIVAAHIQNDARLRLLAGPPLRSGWCGKQHACHVLGGLARHPLLVFIDADVRLAPDALARIAGLLERQELDLASGFPQQQTGTLPEALIVPLIHVLLLGYLPIWLARQSRQPAFAAGCGQLMAVRRDAYRRVGGHAAIRSSRHDGLMLPRAFRQAGCATDVFDASDLASCRMYEGGREVWQGFAKNATEGMAKPLALPLWTLLLGGGHVLPSLVFLPALMAGAWPAVAASAVAGACVYGTRSALARRFRQSWLGVLLHPLGVALLLALQWSALWAALRDRPAVWRGRVYSS